MARMQTSTGPFATDLQAQREYVDEIEASGFDWGLTVGRAFVEGIRDLGYKSNATALDELIDNAIQAGATKVWVVIRTSGTKAVELAVVDNGHGMEPTMIRLCSAWGGTHRFNDRSGFGRYGYGNPSSCVSIGRCFENISKVPGGDWHSVQVDLDRIADGHHVENNRVVVPEPEATEVPAWIRKSVGTGIEHGTVVVMSKLDRLEYKKESTLIEKLAPHFGTIYRNYLRNTDIYVQGKKVEPVDPLFLMPEARYHDLDEDRAEPLEPLTIDVKDKSTGAAVGAVRVRFSFLPPTFARIDKSKERGANNARFPIMRDHNGVIVLRNGRQIDVSPGKAGYLTFNNDDRYTKIEVDFPASLDEEFAITTSKQQIRLSDKMWDLVKEHGAIDAVVQMRKRYDQEKASAKRQGGRVPGKPEPSERAMQESSKFKTTTPAPSERRDRKSEENRKREVSRRAEASGKTLEQAERDFEAEVANRQYRVEVQNLPGAPFYRVEQVGGQRVLYLNEAHRFYTHVYAGPESTPRLRAAVEVLLFSIGEAELDSTDERQLFYEAERSVWSQRLSAALSKLDDIDAMPEEDRDADDRPEAAA